MNASQLASSTQVLSYCVYLQVAGNSNRPVICSTSVHCCLFVCLQGYIEISDSWYLMFDRYKKEILRMKGCLVMLISTHCRDFTWDTHSLSSHDLRLALQFRIKWQLKHRFCFVWVDQTYEPWHKWLSLHPCGPYLASSNISPNDKVNTRYNGQCSEKELFSTSGGQICQIDKAVHTSMSSCE